MLSKARLLAGKYFFKEILNLSKWECKSRFSGLCNLGIKNVWKIPSDTSHSLCNHFVYMNIYENCVKKGLVKF